MEEILQQLPQMQSDLEEMREVVLANLVMLGEIPSPTFQEADRIQFLVNRFSECGLASISTDEAGNGLAVHPGTKGDRNIVLVAHVDTVFPRTIDHSMSVEKDYVTGPGVADNSLGVAVLASLPTILEHLRINLNANLILMGATRSLGRGNLNGLRFFLSNSEMPVHCGVCIEGMKLGRLSFNSIGMIRGEIQCEVPEDYDWTGIAASGAISIINETINQISGIPLPKKPYSTIILGSVEGGTSFNTVATEACLRFEVRSESAEIVAQIDELLNDIVAEMKYRSKAKVTLETLAKRHPGGIGFRHPLVRNVRTIMQALEIEPHVSPSLSELSAFIDQNIPAVTIGVTDGERHNQEDEAIKIEPIYKGLAQLIGSLMAIDGGYCDKD